MERIGIEPINSSFQSTVASWVVRKRCEESTTYAQRVRTGKPRFRTLSATRTCTLTSPVALLSGTDAILSRSRFAVPHSGKKNPPMLSEIETRDLRANVRWTAEQSRKAVANAIALAATTEQIAAENKAIRAVCVSSLVGFRMVRDSSRSPFSQHPSEPVRSA
jgi:hypothetical protein